MRPMVIAHRGASYIAPENTLAAFLAAKELGTDGFETDVQLTKDGKLVMHHNYTIDANSNGKGRIIDMTLEELRNYDFGFWKDNKFKGEKIPTLEECLKVAQDFRLINIELKAPLDRSVPYVEEVAKAIEKSGMIDKIIISAFDHSLLKEVKQFLPDIKVGALTFPPLEKTSMIEFLEKYFPLDTPLHEIKKEDLSYSLYGLIDTEALGIRGKDASSVLMEQIQAMAALYPGKTFRQIRAELKKQQNLTEYVASLDFKLDYLHCEYHSCLQDPTLIAQMHKMGVGVNPWTVDEKEDLEQIVAMEPDGIITNRPDLLM